MAFKKPRNWHSLPEYQALRALMQAGTTAAAARQLGLSQSAISRSVGSLESRLGKTLFERDAGRLRPTQEAVRLNMRLDPLFEALDRIDGPGETVQETLRLVAPPSYAHRYIVSLIASFLRGNPGFFVNLEVTTSDMVTLGVLENRFDLAVTGIEQSRAGIKLIPFRESPAFCVMRPEHPLAKRDKILPYDLHNQELIALTYRHGRRGQLDRLLQQVRAEPRIVAEVSTSFAAADMAREGLGLAIINPFPIYMYRSPDLTFIPFESPMRYRGHFVVSDQRPVPRIARAFMRHLRLNTPSDPYTFKT
ncbi:transcriptional regulator, LysR family [Ruegeria halocynthiae]|uniref:Transcriptional regulator, LysR family n=1 Tax=Ruegeria halocynthiae TaxID=985054 RepID=A0A1H2RQ34_9RHOB|nr:LysR family transcriptional regulator [Ruegeria halocynthiae]SDW21388.1 transcriptional regulator, LysR family [Ruegeria halocynthiae]